MMLDDTYVTDTKLWAVHVQGPADVHAAPSKEAARRKAKELNRYFAEVLQPKDEFDPTMNAVVIEWEYGREDHAADLAKSKAMWA